MTKLEEFQRIIYEHYNDEELLEYYKRKVQQIQQTHLNNEQLQFYLLKIEQIEAKIEDKEKRHDR